MSQRPVSRVGFADVGTPSGSPSPGASPVAPSTSSSFRASPPNRRAAALWAKLRAAVFLSGAWLAAFAALPPPGATSIACVAPPRIQIGECPRLPRMVARAVVSRFIAPHAASVSGAGVTSRAAPWCSSAVVKLVDCHHSVAFIASAFWYAVVNDVHEKLPSVTAEDGGDETVLATRRQREDYANGMVCNACYHYGMLFCTRIRDQPGSVARNFCTAATEAVLFALRSEFPADADQLVIDGIADAIAQRMQAWLIGFNAAAPRASSSAKGLEDRAQSQRQRSPEPQRAVTEKEQHRSSYAAWVNGTGGKAVDVEGEQGSTAGTKGKAADVSRSSPENKKAGVAKTLHGRLVPRTLFFMRPVPKKQRAATRERGTVAGLTNLELPEFAVQRNSRLDVVDTSALKQTFGEEKKRTSSAGPQRRARTPSTASPSGPTRDAVASRFAEKATLNHGSAFSMAQCAPLLALFVQRAGMRAASFATGSAFMSTMGADSVLNVSALHPSSTRGGCFTPSMLDDVVADDDPKSDAARLVAEHGGPGVFASVDAMGSIVPAGRGRTGVEDVACPSCTPDRPRPSALRTVGFQLSRPQTPGAHGRSVTPAGDGVRAPLACELCGRNSLKGHRTSSAGSTRPTSAASRSTGLALRQCPDCQHVFCAQCCKRRVQHAGGHPDHSAHSVANAERHSGPRGLSSHDAAKVFGENVASRSFDCPAPPSLEAVLTSQQSTSFYMGGGRSTRRKSSAVAEMSFRHRSVRSASSASFYGRSAVLDKSQSQAKLQAEFIALDEWVTAQTAADGAADAAVMEGLLPKPGPSGQDDLSYAAEVDAPLKNTASCSASFGDAAASFGDVLFGRDADSDNPESDAEGGGGRQTATTFDDAGVTSFSELRRPMSAFASANGTRIVRPASAATSVGKTPGNSTEAKSKHEAPSSVRHVPPHMRSVSRLKLTSASRGFHTDDHRERLRGAVSRATSAVAKNTRAVAQDRHTMHLLKKRAVDVASRNTLTGIQDLEHTRTALRREYRRTALNSMEVVTEAMQACLTAGLDAELELSALEYCFAVVQEHSPNLEGGGLLRANEFVCRMRPRHSQLLRDLQRHRRERILHLRHRVTEDMHGGDDTWDRRATEADEHGEPPKSAAEEAVAALRSTSHPVTDVAKRRLEQEVQGILHVERTQVEDLLAAVNAQPKRKAVANAQPTRDNEPSPAATDAAKTHRRPATATVSRSCESASWSESRLSQLMQRHREPVTTEKTPMQFVDGKLTWAGTGKEIGSSAEELFGKLATRGVAM